MVAETSPEIAQAVGVIMELSEDEETRLLAESRAKYRRDEYSRRKLVRQEGLQEGLQKGREEGGQEKLLIVVTNMLRLKMAPELIAESTGLSLEEVQALAGKLQP